MRLPLAASLERSRPHRTVTRVAVFLRKTKSRLDDVSEREKFRDMRRLDPEFELAADILRTSIASPWTEIGEPAAIVGARTTLNFFLHRRSIVRRGQHPGRKFATCKTAPNNSERHPPVEPWADVRRRGARHAGCRRSYLDLPPERTLSSGFTPGFGFQAAARAFPFSISSALIRCSAAASCDP